MFKYFAAMEAAEVGSCSAEEDQPPWRGPGSVPEEQCLIKHLQSAIKKKPKQHNPDNPFKKGKVTERVKYYNFKSN